MFDAEAAVDRAVDDAKESGRPPQDHLAVAMLDHLRDKTHEMPQVAIDGVAAADCVLYPSSDQNADDLWDTACWFRDYEAGLLEDRG